jgi:hypothetical protein
MEGGGVTYNFESVATKGRFSSNFLQNSEMQNTYLSIKSSQVIYFFYIQKSITKEDSKLDLAGIQESRVVYHALTRCSLEPKITP